MENRIDNFLTEHDIDVSVKDELCALVSGCFDDLFKHLMSTPIPETPVVAVKAVKPAKAPKAEKIEDVSSVETQDQLHNCTSASLNQYCKENELKVGGNKKEVMDRIWRHLQGTCSDDDIGRSAKPKKVKVKEVVEKHECCGCNTAGAPCAIGGQEKFDDHWFCWRHIIHAKEILEKKNPPPPEPVKEKVTKKKISTPPSSDNEIAEPVSEVPKKIMVKKKVVKPTTELVSE